MITKRMLTKFFGGFLLCFLVLARLHSESSQARVGKLDKVLVKAKHQEGHSRQLLEILIEADLEPLSGASIISGFPFDDVSNLVSVSVQDPSTRQYREVFAPLNVWSDDQLLRCNRTLSPSTVNKISITQEVPLEIFGKDPQPNVVFVKLKFVHLCKDIQGEVFQLTYAIEPVRIDLRKAILDAGNASRPIKQ